MFRTELPLVPHPQQLPLSARLLTIGSCFSDSIGSRLAADKVHTLVNPFGTVFNPVLACRLLRAAAGEDMDWQQHLVQARGRWQSYDLHATLGAESPVELLQHIQQVLRDTGVFLATADVVVLTLGTAWAYRLKETGELVSNCHKVPAEKFDKELLTPDEIINAVAETHAYLRLRNPKLRFVLTVSPVRHTKDTLPLNAVSKSVLRVACHYLSELLPDVSYFPAYELLLDDLRDYRFYAEDMLHPSKVAEDYIWERFARTYFDAGFGRFRKEWEAVRQALSHRPLYLASPEHRQFLESTLEKLERLSGQADVRMELLDVRRQLESLPMPKEPEPEPEDDEERIDIGEFSSATPALPRTRAVAPEPVEEEETEEFETFESISGPSPTEEEEETEQDEDTLATDTAEGSDEAAPAKKKRRSRGGAKRNKKKHAARLAAEAAALESGEAVSIMGPSADDADQETPAASLPPAPAVVITADTELPLQTALERRKRNSRRGGRGRRGMEEPAESVTAAVEENLQPELPLAAPSPTSPVEAPAPAVADDASAAAEAGSNRRPERTGRSASEKRAAALRKPHRASSRFKTLYNEDTAPATEAAAEDAAAVTTTPTEPHLPAAAEPAPVAAAQQPTAEPAKASPAPAASSAIPDTKGTGASGQLSASGKATRTDRPGRAKPVPAAPAETASVETAPEAVVPPATTPPAAPEKAAAKPASKPRRSAAKAAPMSLEAETPAISEAAAEAAPAAAARPARKSRAKSPAAEPAATPAPTAPATPKAAARSRRKPAAEAPAAAEPAAPSPTPAKRARPLRRKPAAPDTPPENV